MSDGERIGMAFVCVDNRLHHPDVWRTIWEALVKRLGIDAIDVQTVPGPDGAFVDVDRIDDKAALNRWSKTLIDAHDLKAIGIVGHEQCAGHPVSDDQHCFDVNEAVQKFREAFPDFAGEVVPFVLRHRSDTKWSVEELTTQQGEVAA